MWRLLRFLVGADAFISYARADSGGYADRLATRLKSERGVSIYLDQELSPVGRDLPAVLLRHLRLSRRLVVIVSDAALQSEALQREVGAFARTPRPVIPIDALQTGERPSWPGLAGAFWRREQAESLRDATPSDAIVTEILESIGADRQSARTRRAAWTAFASVILAVVVSVGLIAAARREALRQTGIAEATAMVNEAEALLRREPRRLQHAALLSAAAMRRFEELGVRSLAADSAVRDVLSQLGRIERRIMFRQRAENVLVTRDGRFVAAGRKDTVELWDMRDGSLRILAIDGATCEAFSGLQFSRDGSHIVAGCTHYGMKRSWARVWRTVDASPVGPVAVSNETIPAYALSADGTFFAVESERYVITIRRTVSGEVVRELKDVGGFLVEFSPSSRYLVIDRSTVWDWQHSDAPMQPVAPGRPDVVFSDDESVVIATDDNKVDAFSFPDRRHLWTSLRQDPQVLAIDAKRVAVRSGSSVDIHDLRSGQSIHRLEAGYPDVMTMRGDEFGFGTIEGAAVYAPRGFLGLRLSSRVGHPESADAIVLLADHRVVSAGVDGALRWKSQTADVVWDGEMFDHAAFSPDSQQVLHFTETNDSSSSMEIRDAQNQKVLHTATVANHAISLSFGGKQRVVVGVSDGNAWLWEPSRRGLIRPLVPKRSKGVLAVAVARDGSVAAVAAGNEVTLVALDRQPPAPVGRILHEDKVEKIAFGRSNDEIVTACSDGRVRLWSVANGIPTVLSATNAVPYLPALAVLDGKFLLVAEGDAIAIRDLRHLAAAPVETIDLVSRAINIVAADGVFASADQHGSLRVWRRGDATEEIARLEVVPEEEPPVLLSPNGRWLGTIGRTAFEVHSLWPADLLPALCGQLAPFADDPRYRAACAVR